MAFLYSLYPYKTTRSKNSDHIRYNLLPDEKVSECHQIIGTFPNKRLVLDDKNVLEIFENYYKFIYIIVHYGRISYSDALLMTPAELSLYYNNFIEDKEKLKNFKKEIF